MKSINVYKGLLIVSLAGLFLGSCKKDFLKEELETERGMDYYKTDAGIRSLSNGTYYQVLKTPFAGEWMYCNTEYGVDEFSVGGDASNEVWNDYDAGFRSSVTSVNSNTISTNAQWDALYIGIGDANLLISNATQSASSSDDIKKEALGEGYFFRGYCYLRLVSQYGAVPLVTEPSTSVNLEFTRAAPKEIYTQIIEDLKQAYALLPAGVGPAKLSKEAAAHFLAKAYLFRASEINDSWNSDTKAADLDAIIPLCDEVIGSHPLATNFADLWDYTTPDGANEKLPEIILSAQFTSDVSATGENHQHIYFGGRYDDLPQMQRDVTGDRPYARLRPSYYMFHVYDQINDSRFWKSFRTKYRLNKASGSYYKNGDLGLIYIINQPGDDRYASYRLNDKVVDPETGKTIPSAYIAYPKGSGGGALNGALNVDVRYPSLSKFFDGSRNAVNDTRGFRDIIIARSAETYLIEAEAKVRLAKLGKGSYADALPYINAVRKRAAFKAGEDRETYYDGGGALGASTSGQNPAINSFMPENSYYESNDIAKTTAATDLTITSTSALPASDNYVINTLGLSSEYDKMLALVLDERSRELAGEFLRWQDLSRTNTLVSRVKAFNFQASKNVKPFHELRPIPQTYLDGIQSGGKALTVEEKQAQQNDGY